MAVNEEENSVELCLNGIPCSAPPCAPYFESCCGCCCNPFGSVGFEQLSAQKIRAPLMLVLSVLSFIQIILSVCAAVGLSSTRSDLKNVPWTSADISFDYANETQSIQMYMGLANIYVESSGPVTTGNKVLDWEEFCGFANQTDYASGSGTEAYDNCNECEEASDSLHSTVIITILSKFGQFTTDLTRSHGPEDVPCQKVFGALVPIMGVITGISALLTFDNSCYKNIPNIIGGASVNPTRGIGYHFEMVITILGILDMLGHALVPLPKEGDDNYRQPYSGANTEKAAEQDPIV